MCDITLETFFAFLKVGLPPSKKVGFIFFK